jgi:hypothetical protein
MGTKSVPVAELYERRTYPMTNTATVIDRRYNYLCVRFSTASISAKEGAGQSRTVPSEPHVAIRLPSREKVIPIIKPPGARVNASCRLATDQNLIVPSQLAETKVLLSGAKAKTQIA